MSDKPFPFIQIPKILTSIVHAVLDFIYPPFCFLCNGRLNANERLVCNRCWEGLPSLDEKEYEDYWIARPGPDHAIQPLYFSRLLAGWEYDSQMQRIVHLLKYNRKRSLALRLGRMLSEIICSDQEYQQANLIIPVPLHRIKLRERGYNQSWLLCCGISEKVNIECRNDVLKRIRHTKSQTELKAAERLENVRGAFRVNNGNFVAGKIVIVVDDLVTTGATMNACAEALIWSGAQKVLALAAARPL